MEYKSTQIARGFGVSIRTLHAWGDKRGLPYQVIDFRGKRTYNIEQVVAWAAEHELPFARSLAEAEPQPQ